MKEIELLLKDLSARIPYRVKFIDILNPKEKPSTLESIGISELVMNTDGDTFELEKIKPYLIPMDEMTEEQEIEFKSTCNGWCDYYWTSETFDWLNKNYFDYRGLIPLGLALSAVGLGIYD